jgi:putative ABC transport system substrate-binding protein
VGSVLVLREGLLFLAQRTQIAALAAKSRLPAVYGFREQVEVGGLMANVQRLPELARELVSQRNDSRSLLRPAALTFMASV